MQPERSAESSGAPLEPEPRRNSLILGGLALACLASCGGILAYVAYRPLDRPKTLAQLQQEAKLTNPEVVRGVAHKMLRIEPLPGYVPIEAEEITDFRSVTFGHQPFDGALLKIKQSLVSVARTDNERLSQERMLMNSADGGGFQTNTLLGSVPIRTRNLTVLGQSVEFQFSCGALVSNGNHVCKAAGAFRSGRNLFALVCTAPPDEFDEEAIVSMIESIAPPDDVKPRSSP